MAPQPPRTPFPLPVRTKRKRKDSFNIAAHQALTPRRVRLKGQKKPRAPLPRADAPQVLEALLERRRVVDIYCDGAAQPTNPGPASAAFVVRDGENTYSVGRALGHKTSNQAEYLALIAALEHALELERQGRWRFFLDSRLVVKQVNGKWKCKAHGLRRLRARVMELLDRFPQRPEVLFIPRAHNEEADRVAGEVLR